METKQLAPGVRVHYIQDEKFKRTRIAMHFVVPSQKEDATCMALLPMVLERGYADCPDMTELSLRLAVEQTERRILAAARRKFGNTRDMASALGCSHVTIARKLRLYGLS